MIKVSINRTCARLQNAEPLTAGMIGKQIELSFSEDWQSLNKIAVFSNGDTAKDVLESQWSDNVITIPHEVLSTPGKAVSIGVYGYSIADGEKVLAIPSVVEVIGTVKIGADPSGDPEADPTLPIWAQLQWEIDHFEVDPEIIAEQVQQYLEQHPVEIQPATASVLGGIKVGEGLSVTADGTLSADSIDAYTKAETDALLDGKQPSGDYATSGELDALAGIVDGKADAADIPSLDGYATEQWVESKGYLTQHQSLAAYRTSAAQDVIDATKQDVISDLATIRSGAALGATALQSDDTEEAETLQIDTVVTSGSTNLITSGAVFAVVGDIEAAINTIRGVS